MTDDQAATQDVPAEVLPALGYVQACTAKHGGHEDVQVELTIAPTTGEVTSARARGDQAGTAFGNCVAMATKKKAIFRHDGSTPRTLLINFQIPVPSSLIERAEADATAAEEERERSAQAAAREKEEAAAKAAEDREQKVREAIATADFGAATWEDAEKILGELVPQLGWVRSKEERLALVDTLVTRMAAFSPAKVSKPTREVASAASTVLNTLYQLGASETATYKRLEKARDAVVTAWERHQRKAATGGGGAKASSTAAQKCGSCRQTTMDSCCERKVGNADCETVSSAKASVVRECGEEADRACAIHCG